jgi:hypothetical protein
MAKIIGVEGLTAAGLAAEVAQGGRFVSFPYVVSVFIMSFRRASDIYYVRPGESPRLKGLPFLLISALLGWWGIPWGLYWTSVALVDNLRGGTDVTQEVVASLTGSPRGAGQGASAAALGAAVAHGRRPKLPCVGCRQHVRAVLQGERYACPYCGSPLPVPSEPRG